MSDRHLLVFVIIILVIVALVSTKVENALAVSASVVAAFYLVKESERHSSESTHKDGYFPQPGAPPPVPQEIPSVWQTSDHGESGYPRGDFNESGGFSAGYPGAIDPQSGGSGDLMYDTWPTFGHADRTVAETDYAPDGNPYDINRLSAPYAAMPCIDDEAYGGALDADEANALQVRSRNDPERVIAGIMRRKEYLDPYLREEVEEAEDSRWWGRHEW